MWHRSNYGRMPFLTPPWLVIEPETPCTGASRLLTIQPWLLLHLSNCVTLNEISFCCCLKVITPVFLWHYCLYSYAIRLRKKVNSIYNVCERGGIRLSADWSAVIIDVRRICSQWGRLSIRKRIYSSASQSMSKAKRRTWSGNSAKESRLLLAPSPWFHSVIFRDLTNWCPPNFDRGLLSPRTSAMMKCTILRSSVLKR